MIYPRFPKEFEKTSSNKFRSSDDMQFSFSYYYFIIHASHRQNVSTFLQSIDIDRNNEYSYGELEILMTRLFTLPISETNRTLFWEIMKNCSASEKMRIFGPENITTCTNLSSLINLTLQNVTTYKHDIVDDKDVTFKMLKSNSTKVRIDLDYVRSNPKKFICLNDNMDHGDSYEHLENKKMLAEFYQTMYPEPSPFEHPPGTVNKYLYKDELIAHMTYLNPTFYVPLCFLSFICIIYVCYLKRRTIKRCLRNILFNFMT
jgi:UDP-N-acetylglucosamine-lysosomal-enzyme